jgi:hypothetical protein
MARRDFLGHCAVFLALAAATPMARAAAPQASVFKSFRELAGAPDIQLVNAVPVTKGPKFHWFSFYDVLQFDPTGRYLLGMEVDFEHRAPKPDDQVAVGLIDLKDDNRWREIGRTTAWCWQQGCRLQWRRGSHEEVLWNECRNGRFVCRIYNVRTGQSRIVPHPIYNMAPDGRTALSYPFERVAFRGYGYEGIQDQFKEQIAPDETGVFRVDLDTGESKLIIPLSKIAALRQPDPYPDKDGNLYCMQMHWNPSGSRFMLYSRRSLARNFGTVVFTAALDGSDIRRVNRDLSHYEWADDRSMLFWDQAENAYCLYQDDGRAERTVLWRAPNGHQTYLPGREWIITDTYPLDSIKHLYLYHIPSRTFVPLGRFQTPAEYQGEWRCDLHPRLSPDGRRVVVDSVHAGAGRQMYLLDIGHVLDDPPKPGPDESLTFTYRILVSAGHTEANSLEQQWKEFARRGDR